MTLILISTHHDKSIILLVTPVKKKVRLDHAAGSNFSYQNNRKKEYGLLSILNVRYINTHERQRFYSYCILGGKSRNIIIQCSNFLYKISWLKYVVPYQHVFQY